MMKFEDMTASEVLDVMEAALHLIEEFQEDEGAECECIPLPVDADGEPIRIGDTLESDTGYRFTVERMELREDGWHVINDRSHRVCPDRYLHVEPDTFTKVIIEAFERGKGAANRDGGTECGDLVNRCMEIAEGMMA